MIEKAKEYFNLGLSVIPVGEKKLPIGSWKKNQSELIEPNFTSCKGIGLVCGAVSGGLECIDIDCKYDLTGKLFENYKLLIAQADKAILRKLVVQSTPSGGYHFIYRCEEIEGNKKLANRHCTEEEKLKNPKDKIRVLVETRGESGYFMVAPSEGYKIIHGSLDKISVLSVLERETLFVCARTLNEVFETPTIKKNDIKTLSENVSPFEDWNNRGDVLSFLESEGWKIKLQRGDKNLLLRPAGEGMWSADWNEAKRIFYVFTSSTEFEQNKGYNASQVLAKLKFRDDFSACAKWLLKEGYGNFTPEKKDFKKEPQVEYLDKVDVKLDDDNFDFVAKKEDCDRYIEQVKNGTFKMGDLTGWDDFDNYWRFKNSNLVMVLGHDNAGKSVVTWFLAVLDCYLNNKNYIIYAGENNVGMLKFKLMEYYLAKPLKKMKEAEFKESMAWVEEHFTIIRNDVPFSYKDMLAIGKKLLTKKKYHRFIIEPYNMLDKKAVNEHQYDYDAMKDMKLFITQTGLGITLNVHAATEALRRVYPKLHPKEGYAMPPDKSHAEGGGKFPNKADDFMIVHRLADHPEHWMWTEIHVQKIKETETGGKRTFKENPYLIKLQADGAGFENQYGINPMRDRRKGTPSNILPPIPKQATAFEDTPPTIKPNGAFTTPMLKKDNFVPPVIEKKEDWLDIDDDAF
jgi:hypothetical protein